MTISKKMIEIFRGLLAAYVFTGVMLALLAFGVYQFEMGEKIVNISIISIYVIATCIGGIYVGKRIKEKKFLWGILLGACYMAVIIMASFLVNQEIDSISTNMITTSLLCLGGGMIGGMIG